MKNQVNKLKKRDLITFIIAIVGITLSTFFALYKTLSSYQTIVTGNISSNIAFYLTKSDYQVQQIYLSSLVPRREPYVYNFSVSNRDGNKTSDVDIEYVLKVVATTNLPLRFELYMNENYLSNDATNLANTNNTTIENDEHNTIFKVITLQKQDLLYGTPSTNNYTLLIYYDESNTNAKYQDTIESIRIVTDSRQIIE